VHLALVAFQHDVVAARDDAHVEFGFQGAEVIVVAAEQLREIDIGGEGETARDRGGFAQRLAS
jgi:hypothetical protein